MKNQFKPIFLTILIAIVLLSCSKDSEDKEVYEEQNFILGFLQTAGFNNAEDFYTGYPLYYGYSFTPLVEGKINSFVIKVPLAFEENTITLWNKSTGEPIATKVVSLPTAYEVTIDVTPIQLIKNKEYVISLTSFSSSVRFNSLLDNDSFPIIEGDIQINNFSVGDNIEAMPNYTFYDYYYGDLSFNFERTR